MSIETDAEARARDALHAAQLYYVQDQTMEQIAAEMKLSRSSVSRLIAHAQAGQDVDEEADPRTDVLLDALLESMSVRDAARVAAKVTGVARDVLYNRALARKKSSE